MQKQHTTKKAQKKKVAKKNIKCNALNERQTTNASSEQGTTFVHKVVTVLVGVASAVHVAIVEPTKPVNHTTSSKCKQTTV